MHISPTTVEDEKNRRDKVLDLRASWLCNILEVVVFCLDSPDRLVVQTGGVQEVCALAKMSRTLRETVKKFTRAARACRKSPRRYLRSVTPQKFQGAPRKKTKFWNSLDSPVAEKHFAHPLFLPMWKDAEEKSNRFSFYDSSVADNKSGDKSSDRKTSTAEKRSFASRYVPGRTIISWENGKRPFPFISPGK